MKNALMDKSGHLKIETFVLKASDRLRKMLKVDDVFTT